ncbi:MAG: patatin-like phospholipase family protein [Actinomycetota bacterium]|nr:patatin-like phospholipase family protein [Actinomycetota bacterium]
MDAPVTVALALGSGGARGYAHIGVIDVLTERGFDVAVVAGSSMGALVGGLYAAGRLDPFTEWVRGLTRFDVLRMLDASLSAPGVIRAEKVIGRVREIVDGALIEDLSVPFTATATDLWARREVWIQRGPLDVAVRASIAIPGVFTPVVSDGRLLVDGGLMNPVPIAPTTAVPTDATIAVDLVGPPSSRVGGASVARGAAGGPVDEWVERFRRSTSQLLDREAVRALRDGTDRGPVVVDDAEPDEPAAAVGSTGSVAVAGRRRDVAEDAFPAGLGKFDVMNEALATMQAIVAGFRRAASPPDVLITIPSDACGSLEFHRAAEMIDLGRNATADALDRAGLTP